MADFTKRRSIYKVIIYLEEFSTRQEGVSSPKPLCPAMVKWRPAWLVGLGIWPASWGVMVDLSCPIQEPLTPCSYWALEMWLMQLKNCILTLINLSLNLRTNIWYNYWTAFKYVWNNRGIWTYFFNCQFYEILLQFKYFQGKFSVWIGIWCKCQIQTKFWKINIKKECTVSHW